MNINLLFEQLSNEQTHIDEFNRRLHVLDEKKRKMCTIHPTDSGNKIRKKCKVAKAWGIHYAPVWNTYVGNTDTPQEPETTTDTGTDAGGVEEAMSSTERMRRFNRRHPEKVRKYLRDTVKDRVKRNRDRAKAVKKHGKKKMKNHDVHHPNGVNGGTWRLAKKDHGRDKKNENVEYVYLSELMEGNIPNGPWILLAEGGAAGHMAHPYEDDSLSFADVKEMVRRGLVGELDAEEPVTEKLDGQNIMFTVRDGRVYFARNKGQVKNKGKNALDVAGIRQMFAGRGNIEKAFTGAAEDLQRAVDALPPEQRDQMFSGGGKFMNVEIILPDTQNVIPYDKSVLVFHGSVAYDDEGNETGRSVDDGRTLSDQLTRVNAQQQKTFGIQGPKTISFSDAQTVENKRALKDIGKRISQLQDRYGLDDKSTIEDYKLAYWENRLIEISQQTGIDFTKEEFEGITRRWALGDKSFKVKDIEDPEKKRWFREFEAKELKREQQQATRPLEQIFLQTGALSLRRVTDLLAANNPEAAAKLKQEVLDTIKKIKETGDTDKLAALQVQIERLESIGIDKVVPSEGMVFMYNGKPYKFTGAFAPVNQILGTLKFDKGKAELTEPTPAEEPAVTTQTTTTPSGEKRTVAIFTGRFQPFHAGHYSIYQSLVKKFGKDNVFIATTDKTEPTKSPFGFKEKQEIITQMFDIPEDKVVQVKNPYAPQEILAQLPPDTTYVTAVSQKDSDRLTGGKYFKNYDEVPDTERKGYQEQGYYIIAPEMQLQLQGKNISGTQVRALFGNPDITDRAKQQIFTMIYGRFDPDIFKKIVNVTTDSEEALKLTQQYGKDSKTTSGEPEKQPRQKKSAKPKTPAEFYKPGDTWQSGNKFAGKNSRNIIRYFSTQDAAQNFANT